LRSTKGRGVASLSGSAMMFLLSCTLGLVAPIKEGEPRRRALFTSMIPDKTSPPPPSPLPSPKSPPSLLLSPLSPPAPPAASDDLCVKARRYYIDHTRYAINTSVVLGKGGFATVFTGLTPDGSECAVKVQDVAENAKKFNLMTQTLLGKPTPRVEDTVSRTAAEYEVQETISSCPGTAGLFGQGVYPSPLQPESHVAYLVRNLGGDLRLKNWPIADRNYANMRSVMLQLASGLACMHQRRVFHADVKPDNFAAVDENRAEIVLADFGLSGNVLDGSGPGVTRDKQKNFAYDSPWQTGKWLQPPYIAGKAFVVIEAGTAEYVAPEAFYNCFFADYGGDASEVEKRLADPFAADVFALGQAFKELVLGIPDTQNRHILAPGGAKGAKSCSEWKDSDGNVFDPRAETVVAEGGERLYPGFWHNSTLDELKGVPDSMATIIATMTRVSPLGRPSMQNTLDWMIKNIPEEGELHFGGAH